MLVSIGQGGNQLAACVWQRAHQQQQQQQQPQRAAASRSAARSHAAGGGAAATSSSSSSSVSSVSASSGSSVPSVPSSPWFALDGYAHGVLIDSEPKVVAQMDRLGRSLAAAAAATSSSTSKATRQKLHKQAQQQQQPHLPAAATAAAAAPSIFRPANLQLEQYGRGNNWAMGYFGRLGDEGRSGSLLSSTLECVRREAERMDACTSMVLLHSLAGGTGSGLGSRVAEEVREAFPKHFLLSVSIAPFGTGDTPLQHYNTLLSLAHLYPAVDGLVLASNADISRTLATLATHRGAGAAAMAALGSGGSGGSGGGNAPVMSFAGINTYLSACVADLLAPTRTAPSLRQMEMDERRRTSALINPDCASAPITASATVTGASPLLATPSLYGLVSHVAPLPAYKLLELWSSAGLGASSSAAHMDPRAGWQPSWKGCMETLHRFVPRDNEDLAAGFHALDPHDPASPLTGAGRAIAYTVYARGDSSSDPVDACYESIAARMQRLFPAAPWQPHPLDLVSTPLPRLTWRPEERSSGQASQCESTRSLSVCVNRSRTSLALAPSVRKARLLLQHKAYVHWYTRYGVEVSELHDAVDSIEDVIRDYQAI